MTDLQPKATSGRETQPLGASTYFKLSLQNVVIVLIFLVGTTASAVGVYFKITSAMESYRVEAASNLESYKQSTAALIEANRITSKNTDDAIIGKLSILETNESRLWSTSQLHERWLIALGIKTGIGPPSTPSGNP